MYVDINPTKGMSSDTTHSLTWIRASTSAVDTCARVCPHAVPTTTRSLSRHWVHTRTHQFATVTRTLIIRQR